jgi:ACT domain-containing protein
MVLRKDVTIQIKNLLKKNPNGLSITKIVKALGINRNTAGRYLENRLVSGQVEMRRFGMAKIYMLSQRVPLSAVLSISSELGCNWIAACGLSLPMSRSLTSSGSMKKTFSKKFRN